VANAVGAAAGQLRPGDVLLVEQHTYGPLTGRPCPAGGNCGQWEFVPMEYYQESFDVIRRLTAGGVVVVEAAGNGTQRLDMAIYLSRFNRWIRNSGALLVGASGAGDNLPSPSTNSADRIDVHAWGDGVLTLGYGLEGDSPPFDGPPRPINRRYTRSFRGTSSASAIVAGAVASLQGVRRTAGREPLTPPELADLLQRTGSPQAGTRTGVSLRPIGKQPDLRAAIAAAMAPGGGFRGPGVYTIHSKASGKVLDIDIDWFAGQNNGQRLLQADYHGGLNQQFTIEAAAAGGYRISPRHTHGKVLDVAGWSIAPGAAVHQWTWHGGASQRFRIEPVGDLYRIVSENSGSVLGVPGSSREHRAPVQQLTSDGGDNQLFHFNKIN